MQDEIGEPVVRQREPWGHVVHRWVRLVALRVRGDRGDVPGWVLVTIMTAGLVTALWLVADDKLTQLFNDALDSVVGGAP